MADDTEKQVAEAVAGKSGASGGGLRGTLLLVITSVMVAALFGGAGFMVARLMGSTPKQAEAAAPAEHGEQSNAAPAEHGDFAYIDFEPITVNLNEPRLGRYVRASITLEVRKENEKAVKKLIEGCQARLKNWLNVHVAGRTLDEVRGTKSLNQLAREIQDAFNEQLFPNQRPMIEGVFFKEIVIQ